MRKIIALTAACLLTLLVMAQTPDKIEVNVANTPLSQVLLGLKENYGFQFAYDSDLLSAYSISVSQSFSSQQEALQFLIRGLPLKLEKSGDVFLILPVAEGQTKDTLLHISGQVLEANTYEPLPYSYILVNQRLLESDKNGNFSFIASADKHFNLQISHLGYCIFDTVVSQSMHRKFYLFPQIEAIQEVKVLSNLVEYSTQIGDKGGQMKLNHRIAPVLPGHGDNSVFNLLRLMPGITAAGESSNDLLIWGAYESQSKIQLDGFTVFGLKNFNDDIAVVNPFVVQNIEVLKGGYQARYGERVGAIVDIRGKDGNMQKPVATFSINSTTLNGMLQLPISKKSSVYGAYRQTYYPLYDPTNIKFYARENSNNTGTAQNTREGFDVQPDFVFRDANLKYVFRNDKGSRFALSSYIGGDHFQYDMERELTRNTVRRKEEEENRQVGGSLQYSRVGQNGNTSNFTLAYSALRRQFYELNEIENTRNGTLRTTNAADSENTVDELSFEAQQIVNFRDGHRLLIGGGAINNQTKLSRVENSELLTDEENQSLRFYSFLQDELTLFKMLELKTGMRVSYANQWRKWYAEPRVSASLALNSRLKVNAAWGKYRQFLTKTTRVDSAYNFIRYWTNADESQVSVQNANHYLAGIAYNHNGFTISTEAYYKTLHGLTRYFGGADVIAPSFYQGKARSKGLDVFVKKTYGQHMAWVSYSLGSTREHFPYYFIEPWQPAPQQQKHELKLAAIVNWKSFFFSANYLYGSGFERFDSAAENGLELNRPYKRLDASVVYKLNPRKMKLEAGISVLNVFDTENVKYSNISVSSVDELSLVSIYADAVPFTPALFLKVEW